MFLSAIDGEYSPSFFTIKLDIDDSNINKLQLINNSTFIHEYVHFMQDLILPYCIRNNLTYIRLFNDICQYGLKNGKILLPFKNWSEDTAKLKSQFEYTFGSLKNKKNIGIKSIESSYYTLEGFDTYQKKNRKSNVYKYTLTFVNNSKYVLGARDLLEYIAYNIEIKHYNANATCFDFPYRTIDILFDYYGYSEIEKDKRILISEYCLHNDNPIRFLIYNVFGNDEFMTFIANNTIDELYNSLPLHLSITTDYTYEPFFDKEKRRLDDFVKQLSYIYSHSKELGYWLNLVNQNAKLYFQGRFIFSEIYRMPYNEFCIYFINIIEQFVFPLLINKDDKTIVVESIDKYKTELEYFLIVERFVNFAQQKNSPYKKCPIGNFCTKNYSIKCSKKYQPSDNSNTCLFKEFLRTKNIENIAFK